MNGAIDCDQCGIWTAASDYLKAASKSVAIFSTSGPTAKEHMMMSSDSWYHHDEDELELTLITMHKSHGDVVSVLAERLYMHQSGLD